MQANDFHTMNWHKSLASNDVSPPPPQLPDFPPEIYANIFSYLPRKCRIQAAAVCQSFRWLLQPMLFEHVELKMITGATETQTEWTRGKLSFLRQPRIANMVKICTMTVSINRDNVRNWVGLPFADPMTFDPFFDVLSLFRNMSYLSMSSLNLSHNHTEVLLSMDRLQHLEVHTCITQSPEILHPLANLRYLEVSNSDSHDGSEYAWASLAHSLATQTLVLPSPSASTPLLAKITRRASLNLESLIINVDALMQLEFRQFLVNCPSIKKLRFTQNLGQFFSIESTQPSPLPKNPLPILQIFSGPANICPMFLLENNTVRHLTLGSASLATLINVTSNLQDRIESLWTHTTELGQEILRVISQFASLKALSIDLTSIGPSIKDHLDLLKNISSRLPPGLEYFSLHIEYTKRNAPFPLVFEVLRTQEFLQRLPRLNYVSFSQGCNAAIRFNPATGRLIDQELSFANWQEDRLGLYRPIKYDSMTQMETIRKPGR